MNVLYQLALVLETQMPLVQGKLMIWMLVTMACRVAHFGTLLFLFKHWCTGMIVQYLQLFISLKAWTFLLNFRGFKISA